jgi:uncharacterized protein
VTESPSIIPLFALPNLVLFPGIKVPLHIFEPRYREMVADVSASHGIVGMMMLKGGWERDYYVYPDIFEIGCAGRIDELVKLPDGRINLILEGLSEFRVMREIRNRSYREAEVAWCPSERSEMELDLGAMAMLKELLFSFLGEVAGRVWESVVEERGLRDADLINFLCFHLDVTPIEKQTLLEARDTRAGVLLDVLTFKVEEGKLGPRGSGGGPSAVQ